MTHSQPAQRSKHFGTAVQLSVVNTDLRDLLEANLAAIHAILDDHERTLDTATRALAGLRADIRALGDARAPWVKALAETRALLYVALREVVTANEPHDTLAWTHTPEG